MHPDTPKRRLAILGGDDREIILLKALHDQGYHLKVFGFPASLLPVGIPLLDSISEAMRDVDAIILPMPGISNKGMLFAKHMTQEIIVSPDNFAGIPPGIPVFVGAASPYLKNLADQFDFVLIEVADLDEIAIPNSVPSAEGAIQLAMEKLPITIHRSHSLVIGYGRVAETLSLMLKGLGAEVTVAARNPSQLAKCRVLGYHVKELQDLSQYVEKADVIFNTVPAPVIGASILAHLKEGAWIIDLASSPGGTDFETAKKLGVNACLAPGLPGKVAPVTAGKILAKAYPVLLESWFSKSG
ncbi:dipicolinate synthase subunit DpsA [Candidatus Formimonas warabiya]|uniref:Dipicolinate synthase subunit DpsA n=1 Tax=Formimonas warabiya TaxID=1761012 RepID=A0A3G1KP54_FORW1|nr:dipicolinate synthase subunit DpsA [Candidatus Formimonas warabiya]ATW24216.1 hypothetical protein DCMF_04915 [Candidatus Formimonas warabiya]